MKQAITSFAIIIGLCGSAIAADVAMPTKAPPLATPPAIPGWTFSLTPYLWAISLESSTTVKGRTTDADLDFFQLLHREIPKDLFELAARGEARYDRFALLTDIVYVKLGLGANVTRTRGTDEIGAAVGVSAGLTVKMLIAEMAAAYEVARWSGITSPTSNTALDLYAGGRAWWQHADAQVSAFGTVNIFDLSFSRAGVLSASKSVSWVDPFVGIRLRHQFAPAWNLAISGDVGGFDVGSKFSWQALAALDYEICRTKNVTWSGMLGYKALSVDYSQGSGLSLYKSDMTLHGPIFGITARF